MRMSDSTPPAVACRATPDVLWPANHRMVPVNVSVEVTDAGSGAAGFVLTSITSSEPDEGSGDGDRPHDIAGFTAGTASTGGLLRAERSGGGAGRVYTFTYTGLDRAGNTATCRAAVSVPHDRRQ